MKIKGYIVVGFNRWIKFERKIDHGAWRKPNWYSILRTCPVTRTNALPKGKLFQALQLFCAILSGGESCSTPANIYDLNWQSMLNRLSRRRLKNILINFIKKLVNPWQTQQLKTYIDYQLGPLNQKYCTVQPQLQEARTDTNWETKKEKGVGIRGR